MKTQALGGAGIWLLLLVVVLVTIVGFPAAGARKFDDSVYERLANMTVREKVGQMTQIGIQFILIPGTKTKLNKPLVSFLVKNQHIGSVLQAPSSAGGFNLDVKEWITLITELQTIFINEGSKIPMIYGMDSVHGAVFVDGATFFPQQIGAGASFNRDLVKKMGAITAKDSRLVGLPWVFAPILDLCTEPRWARVYETFGEDPYLVSELGAAIIKGIQGEPINLRDPTKAAACMKHFIGYGEPRTGKDRNPTWIPDRFLYEYFVPPFQAAIDAGVATTMESYNDVNGEPVCASEKYLKKLLRDEMGFEGMLVTDWAEIRDLSRFHKIAENEKEATRITMERTSVDMSMVAIGTTFFTHLLNLVEEGIIPESRLDESAGRILQLKEDLGLFENPLPDPDSPLLQTIGSREDRDVALELCRESVTLLENPDEILPLSPSDYPRILVTGPSSNSLTHQCGGWTVNWQGAPSDDYFSFGTTILGGIQQIATNSEIVHMRGCDIEGEFEEGELEAVVAAAQDSDVVILAIGERTYAERFGDIDDLTLPRGQLDLAKALIATGVPVVVVLIEGRPRVLENALDGAAAVLHGYLPALEGGQAIAEIIFGLTNPSGKLPLSYPKTTGTSPLQYYHKVTEEPNFMWEFGHGLSYSTIRYSNLKLSNETITPRDTLTVTVDVTNNGPYDAKETVLLFLTDVYREITPEVKRLRRFEKISLANGEQKTVTFQLTIEELSFIGISLKKTYEPGEFKVAIGALSKSFHLVV